MSVMSELLEYQKVDAQLRKIEQEVAASEEQKKFSQANKFMKSAPERFEAREHLNQFVNLLRRELKIVAHARKGDVFRAESEKYFIHFGVVHYVLLALFSLYSIKGRLGNVHVSVFN